MQKKTKIAAVLGGAILVAGIGAALAVGPHGMHRGGFGMAKMLAYVDINRDGTISLDEVEKIIDEKFSEFDGNKDGSVTEDEIEALVRERIGRHVKRLTRRFDRDKDGQITKAEFGRFAKERFRWNDLNDDGKITKDELPPRLRFIHNPEGQEDR